MLTCFDGDVNSLVSLQGRRNRGVGGQHAPPPLTDQVTLSEPEGADYAHYINTDPRIFRPSYGPALVSREPSFLACLLAVAYYTSSGSGKHTWNDSKSLET